MEAYNFSNTINTVANKNEEGQFSFGLNKKNAAEVFRKLADDLEQGRVILTGKVKVLQVADSEDFTTTTVRFTIAEKRTEENKTDFKKLYGTCQFPVEAIRPVNLDQ